MQHLQTALVVSNAKRRTPLLDALGGLNLQVHTASDCREARSWAEKQAAPILLLSDLTLNDGNWWSVCQDLASRKMVFEVLVVLPSVNENADPILCRGAFGVLRPPYDSAEARRLIESALAREWPAPSFGRARSGAAGGTRAGFAVASAAS